ncbi:flagellar assembly protein FliH [Spirochaeta cellobiosiphila]|uniref:flagellar assembly protein FliH n=1 Tax=Spirochaeta cellobiosiphila TaxID=504483 RepID=UPI0003F63644|nr:flagellar assembly protein FliH [Spirochaeta cellobiosiphila]
MAKNVFRPIEITNLTNQKVSIAPPENPFEEVVELVEEDEYTGPTVEELRKEAEDYKKSWELEKQAMINSAQAEAESMIKNAEQVAFDRVKNENEEAQKIKEAAEVEASKLIEDAKYNAERIEIEAKDKVKKIEEEAYNTGKKEGYDIGYAEGQAEVERLINRIRVIVNKLIERRTEVIESAETQIINLVILIAKKVVKVISENQKNVVINNVIQGLRKLKTRGNVVVRVNMSDLKITTEHIQDFISQIENISAISVMEDTTVEKGGCIIETDFGQIDARISSQLNEIEEKIIELMPIKSRTEG